MVCDAGSKDAGEGGEKIVPHVIKRVLYWTYETDKLFLP
jgi:hypothetical protein